MIFHLRFAHNSGRCRSGNASGSWSRPRHPCPIDPRPTSCGNPQRMCRQGTCPQLNVKRQFIKLFTSSREKLTTYKFSANCIRPFIISVSGEFNTHIQYIHSKVKTFSYETHKRMYTYTSSLRH